jgi:branched-chain amino acid transport system ATP-binding protein
MNALNIENVTKRFGGLVAVRDVRMDIPNGERRGLIGPNGAGKTTLFNLIAGDLHVTSGKIIVYGHDVTKLPPHRRVRYGLRRTYQTSALFDQLTVKENLYLGVIGPQKKWHLDLFSKVDRDSEHMDKVHEISESVRMSNRLLSKVRDLSHGERRQLEIGLALAHQPQFIMLDEPAAGLSIDERNIVVELLNQLDRSITLLLIEHDMEVALNVSERVTVLHEGEIIAEGTPKEISDNVLVQNVYLGETLHE